MVSSVFNCTLDSNSFPNDKILDLSKLKAFADGKLNSNEKQNFGLGRIENIVGNRENAGYTAFSPFPTVFSKAVFLRVVKTRDCVEKC